MTYNIPFEQVGGTAWWFVPWIAAGTALAVYGAFVAAKKRKHFRRFGIFRGFVTILLGVAGITTGIVFASLAHHQLELDRQDAVAGGWDLDRGDVGYLLEHRETAPLKDCWFSCRTKTPTTALVTLGGKPVDAYLLVQGDSLRLIVGDKPVPVVNR